MSVLAKTAHRPEMRGKEVALLTVSEKSSIFMPSRFIWSSKKDPVPPAQCSFTANSGTSPERFEMKREV